MGGEIYEYTFGSTEAEGDIDALIEERAEKGGIAITEIRFTSPDFVYDEESKQLLGELPEGTTRCVIVAEADDDVAVKLFPRGTSVPREYANTREYRILNGVVDGDGVFREFATKEEAFKAGQEENGGGNSLFTGIMNVTHVATEDGQDWFYYCFGAFYAI